MTRLSHYSRSAAQRCLLSCTVREPQLTKKYAQKLQIPDLVVFGITHNDNFRKIDEFVNFENNFLFQHSFAIHIHSHSWMLFNQQMYIQICNKQATTLTPWSGQWWATPEPELFGATWEHWFSLPCLSSLRWLCQPSNKIRAVYASFAYVLHDNNVLQM